PSLGETAVLFLTIESKAGDRVRVLSANPAKNAGHGSPTECSAKSYGHGRRLRARRGAPFAATRPAFDSQECCAESSGTMTRSRYSLNRNRWILTQSFGLGRQSNPASARRSRVSSWSTC